MAFGYSACVSLEKEPQHEHKREFEKTLGKGYTRLWNACPDEARYFFERAQGIAARKDNVRDLSRSLLAFGKLEEQKERRKEARAYWQHALRHSKQNRFYSLAIKAELLLIHLDVALGDDDHSLLERLDLLNEHCRIQSPETCGLVLGVMGKLKSQMGRHADAEIDLSHARKINELYGFMAEEADNHINLAQLKLTQNEPYDALVHFKDALNLDRSSGSALGIAHDLSELAAWHQKHGQEESAINYSLRALSAWESLGNAEEASAMIALTLSYSNQLELELVDQLIEKKKKLEHGIGLTKTCH